jgi:exopolyphosphatase/pppGpp-phosphohydrolase
VLTLMRLLRIDEITVSKRGIREGMLLDFIAKNAKSHRRRH